MRRLLVLILATTWLAACGSSSTPNVPSTDLRSYITDGSVGGASQPNVKPGVPYVFSLQWPLCTVNKPVQITSVTLHDPDGLRLIDWAPWTMGSIGDRPGSARGAPEASPGPISESCDKHSRALHRTVGVSVVLEAGVNRGFTKGWNLYSDSGSIYVPWTLALCPGATCKSVYLSQH